MDKTPCTLIQLFNIKRTNNWMDGYVCTLGNAIIRCKCTVCPEWWRNEWDLLLVAAASILHTQIWIGRPSQIITTLMQHQWEPWFVSAIATCLIFFASIISTYIDWIAYACVGEERFTYLIALQWTTLIKMILNFSKNSIDFFLSFLCRICGVQNQMWL